eukprot:scaffold2155_cov96-Cylindrotheca_fusiformis.AAC.1
MEECYEPRTSSRSTISVDEEEADYTTPSTATMPSCSATTAVATTASEPHTPIIGLLQLPAAQASSQDAATAAADDDAKDSNDFKLAIAFVSMVLVATGVSVMGKLV